MLRRICVVSCFVTAAACAKPSPAPGPSPQAQKIGCGSWICPENAASVGNGLPFFELDASMTLPNTKRVGNSLQPYLRIKQFLGADAAPLDLRVNGHEIQGTRRVSPNQWLFQRKALIG